MGTSLAASAFLGPRRSSRCGRGLVRPGRRRRRRERARAWDGAPRPCTPARPTCWRRRPRPRWTRCRPRRRCARPGTSRNTAPCTRDSGLGDALQDVARLIKADVGLQVAAVDYGDWDMHSDMGTVDGGWMVDHLTELSGAGRVRHRPRPELNDVSLVTLTEFGRRVEENGSGGVDHGFGQVGAACSAAASRAARSTGLAGSGGGRPGRRRRGRRERLPVGAGRGAGEALPRKLGRRASSRDRLGPARHRPAASVGSRP